MIDQIKNPVSDSDFHRFDDSVVVPALMQRLSTDAKNSGELKNRYFSAAEIDLDLYDYIIVCLSGGKDSIASLLRLIGMGVPLHKVELWHHEVDGREGSTLMDWPFMADYTRQLADAFGVPIYFSWLEGGFEAEMLKDGCYSRPHKVETPNGLITLARDEKRSRPGTRLRFPQVSANLQTRWCSSALKIDVGRRALNNQARFDGKKTLFITGERREESSNRARYNQFEAHACDRRLGRKARHVDTWRPILHWSEEQVWEIMKHYGVLSPVPYRLGWGRSSCMKCIFNDKVIWATLRHYFPGSLDSIAAYENRFGTTINRNRINVLDITDGVIPLEINDREALTQALSHTYSLPVVVSAGSSWFLPPGAFRSVRCGPT